MRRSWAVPAAWRRLRSDHAERRHARHGRRPGRPLGARRRHRQRVTSARHALGILTFGSAAVTVAQRPRSERADMWPTASVRRWPVAKVEQAAARLGHCFGDIAAGAFTTGMRAGLALAARALVGAASILAAARPQSRRSTTGAGSSRPITAAELSSVPRTSRPKSRRSSCRSSARTRPEKQPRPTSAARAAESVRRRVRRALRPGPRRVPRT